MDQNLDLDINGFAMPALRTQMSLIRGAGASFVSRNDVLIIGDTTVFGSLLRPIIESGLLGHSTIRYSTYDRFQMLLTPRTIPNTQLFVLELWRTYPTGLRVEGVAVAAELLRQRATPLIVSHLSIAREIQLPWYWDLSSEDGFAERCAALLNGERTNGLNSRFSILAKFLVNYLAKPSGHESEKSEA